MAWCRHNELFLLPKAIQKKITPQRITRQIATFSVHKLRIRVNPNSENARDSHFVSTVPPIYNQYIIIVIIIKIYRNQIIWNCQLRNKLINKQTNTEYNILN